VARDAEGRKWCELRVSDTGVGIPPEIMESIFEPFFTTKERGQGTGLGLSMSQSIIRGFGGEISVTSQVGTGTQFTVRLPAV
jgi:signal transduction histidine kinase